MTLLAISLGLQATFWGFVSGSALLVGAAVGYLAKVPQKIIAFIMAFGSGVLISALALDLMEEAYRARWLRFYCYWFYWRRSSVHSSQLCFK